VCAFCVHACAQHLQCTHANFAFACACACALCFVCVSMLVVQPRRDKLAADIAAGRATVHTGKANKGVAPSGADATPRSGVARQASW